MRILFLTSSDNASGGGRQALYLASGFTERGHEVSFFAPPASLLRSLAPDLDWRDLPEERCRWRKALEGAMHPGQPVIVHAFHNKAVKTLAWCGTLWRFTGRPVACVAHRGVINRPKNILPYIAPGIRLFAVNSQACLDTLPLYWRKEAGMVVPNCVPDAKVTPRRAPEDVRAELGLPPETTIIGSVSNNSPVKGLEFLLRAFARLVAQGAAQDAVLCLVGGEEAKWERLCAALGIRDRVLLVPRTELVADYLQLFTLFVLPSLSESSPNTLLEAMCMGLPAVCSNVGGVGECIDAPRFLVPPGDDKALAAALAAALADRLALAAAGRRNKDFSARFRVAGKLETMGRLYTDLLRPYHSAT